MANHKLVAAAAAVVLVAGAVAFVHRRTPEPSTLHTESYATYAGGDWNGAISALDKAIASHPGEADLYNRRGATLQYLGRYREAESDFERAIRLRPQESLGWHNLIDVRDWTNRGDKSTLASDYAEHVVRVEPANALYHRNLARLLDAAGKVDEAKKELRAAIALAPDEGTYYLEFASYMQEHGAPEEAIVVLQAAARREMPERLTILDELATVAFTRQEYQVAADAYAQAAAIAPGNRRYGDMLAESRRRATRH